MRRPASASSVLDGHTGLAFEVGTAYHSGLPGFTVRSRTSAHQARLSLNPSTSPERAPGALHLNPEPDPDPNINPHPHPHPDQARFRLTLTLAPALTLTLGQGQGQGQP